MGPSNDTTPVAIKRGCFLYLPLVGHPDKPYDLVVWKNRKKKNIFAAR